MPDDLQEKLDAIFDAVKAGTYKEIYGVKAQIDSRTKPSEDILWFYDEAGQQQWAYKRTHDDIVWKPMFHVPDIRGG